MVRRHKTRARDAFTLIEVMIAMTVLALALASSMIAITAGFRILEDARLSTLASQVLQSEMETLRLKHWGEIPNETDVLFTVDSTLTSAAFNRFVCTRTVRTSEFPNTKRVILTVDWTSTSGQARRRRYHTLIAEDGLNDYFYRKS